MKLENLPDLMWGVACELKEKVEELPIISALAGKREDDEDEEDFLASLEKKSKEWGKESKK